MIEIGKTQRLEIKRFTNIGAFLNVEDKLGDDDILLPRKFVKKEWELGQSIDVFVYKDNENRPIATTLKPKVQLGQLALLQVKDINRVGAFLDWGLEKDLLLPHEEQLGKIRKFSYYLVGVYLDKSERLTATMRVKPFFEKEVPYEENDWVKGTIYSFNSEIGAFVIIDNKFDALLPANEIDGILKVGDSLSARVKQVKNDGKIDLTTQNRAHEDLSQDAELIYTTLRDNGGFLKVHDKSDKRLIYSIFKMSKSQFKRAIGRLYKQKRIVITDEGIRMTQGGKNER